MRPDEDDDEGPFEEIAPGVEVRSVSDEYAAEAMGITPEELRAMIEGIEAGDVKTYTLDEVIAEMSKDDPEFVTLLEQERAKRGRRKQ